MTSKEQSDVFQSISFIGRLMRLVAAKSHYTIRVVADRDILSSSRCSCIVTSNCLNRDVILRRELGLFTAVSSAGTSI